jgi:nickel/cobalt transporter (NicO) family protein
MHVLKVILLVLMLAVLVTAQPAVAQEQPRQDQPQEIVIDRSKLLVQRRTGPSVSFLENPAVWMSEKQREFYGSMSKSLRQLKSHSAATAAVSLMLISFLYGAFHAAGPGHGKAIVSAWVLANRSDLRRGLLIAFLSALIQALSAITIVSTLVLLFSNAAALARQSAGVLESVSFAMIAGVGLYLMAQAWRSPQQEHRHEHGHHHDHSHHHHHGHTHSPAPSQVKPDATFLQMLTLAAAVGIRPCTGAILVLVFAWSAGLYWAGVLSTLVMGAGVFLTIAAIATLTVTAKSWALRLSAVDNQRVEQVARILKFGGGAVIAAMGILLFWGSRITSGGLT